jgi:hypothetical protein
MRNLYLLAALVVLLGITPAMADQLTLGGDGTIFFCSTGGVNSPIVISTSSSCSPQGGTAGSSTTGSFESPTGNTVIALQPWSLAFPTGLEIGALSGGVFQFVNQPTTTAFSWGGASGTGTVTGNVTWSLVSDGTPVPRFFGNLVVTGNTAPAGSALANDYQPGHSVAIDFTVNLGSNPTLETIYARGDGASTSGTFSSGEVPAAPEPTSIFFLGTGILAAGTVLRARFRKA